MSAMIVRANDSGGDWTFGAGKNNYLQNQAAAIQLIQTRLLSFVNDCFFDSTSGVNWFGYLGSTGANNQLALQLAVSAVILNTQDQNGNQIVQGLQQLSVSLNRTTRKVSISYQAVTVYSTITSSFVYDIGGTV
jgi:hypothetical protein